MIEFCNFRRMLISIIVLICLCLVVLAVESYLAPPNDKYPHYPGSQGENTSDAPCWQTEDYIIRQQCAPCSEFEKVIKHKYCIPTGFKEMISCQTSGDVYRSCDKVLWLEERNFYIFESSMAGIGVISAFLVTVRQKQLDRRMMQRIQQQISAGV